MLASCSSAQRRKWGPYPRGLASCSQQPGPNRPVAALASISGIRVGLRRLTQPAGQRLARCPCSPFPAPGALLPPTPTPAQEAPKVLPCSGPEAPLPYPSSLCLIAPQPGSSQLSCVCRPYPFPLCSPALPHPSFPAFCDQICQPWEEFRNRMPNHSCIRSPLG